MLIAWIPSANYVRCLQRHGRYCFVSNRSNGLKYVKKGIAKVQLPAITENLNEEDRKSLASTVDSILVGRPEMLFTMMRICTDNPALDLMVRDRLVEMASASVVDGPQHCDEIIQRDFKQALNIGLAVQSTDISLCKYLCIARSPQFDVPKLAILQLMLEVLRQGLRPGGDAVASLQSLMRLLTYTNDVFTKWDGWRNFCVPLQLYGDFVQQLIDLYNSMTAELRSTIDRTTDSPGACAAPTLLDVLERVLTLTGSNQKVDVCMRTLTVQLLCSNGELGYAMEARELSRRLVDRKLVMGRCAYNVLFDHLDTSNPQCLTEAFLIISAMTAEWKILEKDKWYHDKRVQHQVIDGNNNNNRVDFQHLFEIIAPSALTYNKYLGVIESVVRRGTFASSSQVTSMLLDLINRFQMSNLVVPNKNCLVRVGHLSLLMKDDKTLHRVLSALRSMATLSTSERLAMSQGDADGVYYTWQLPIEDLIALSTKHCEAQGIENVHRSESHYLEGESDGSADTVTGLVDTSEDSSFREEIDQDLQTELLEHEKDPSSSQGTPLTAVEENAYTFLYPSQYFANRIFRFEFYRVLVQMRNPKKTLDVFEEMTNLKIDISAANLSLLFVQMVKIGCLRELRTMFLRVSKRHKDRRFLHVALYVQALAYSKNLSTACKAFVFVRSYKASYQESLLQSQIPFNMSESRYLRVLMYRLLRHLATSADSSCRDGHLSIEEASSTVLTIVSDVLDVYRDDEPLRIASHTSINPNNLVLKLLHNYVVRQWSNRAVYDQFFDSLSNSAHPRMGELLELLFRRSSRRQIECYRLMIEAESTKSDVS